MSEQFQRWEVSDYPSYDFAPGERDVLLAGTGEQVCTAYNMMGGWDGDSVAAQIVADHNEAPRLRELQKAAATYVDAANASGLFMDERMAAAFRDLEKTVDALEEHPNE